jgi:uncharacterized membrane protein
MATSHAVSRIGTRRRTRPPAPRRVPTWVPAASLSLSLVALAISSYLTVTHYGDPTALACPDTGIVNCTLVTTSSWSVVLGVPLAVLGLAWAVVMTGLTVPLVWRAAAPWVDGARLVVSGAGAAMVLYLVEVELFRIGAICLWCTAMHITAVSLFGVVLAGRAASSRPDPALPEDGTGVSRRTERDSGTFASKARPAAPPQ